MFPLWVFLIFCGCSKIPPADDHQVACLVENRIEAEVEWRWGKPAPEVQAFIEELVCSPLSAEGAIQIALLQNPKIQSLFEELGIAQAEVVEAGLLSNPAFELEVRYPRRAGLSTNIEYLITQSLVDIFLIPLRTKLATTEFEKVKMQVAHEMLELAFDVKETYYELIGLRQKIDPLEVVLEIANIEAELLSRQQGIGNVNRLDFERAAAETLEAKIELAEVQGDLIQASEKLHRLLGFPVEVCLNFPHDLPKAPFQGLPLEVLESAAIDARLDLQAARLEIRRISDRLGLKEPWTYTDLSAGLAGEREPDGANLVGPGFAFELPLFNYGQAARMQLFAELRQAQNRLEELEIATRSEVREAYQLLTHYSELVDLYQNQLLPTKANVFGKVDELYARMGVGIDQLLKAKKEQERALKNYAEMLKNVWKARVKLERALGGNLCAYL